MIVTPRVRKEVLESSIMQGLKRGELCIDNSDYVGWNQCFMKGLFAGALKRQSTGSVNALSFGSAVHKAMEVIHDPLWQNETTRLEKAIEVARVEAINEGLPSCSNEKRNMESLEQVIASYYSHLKTFGAPFKPLIMRDAESGEPYSLVEQGFRLPLGSFNINAEGFPDTITVYWQGKIDLIAFDESDNGIWIVDHKTTSVMGAQFADDKMRSNQMLGYTWAARKLTEVLGKEVKGVIINALAIRKNGFEFKTFKIPYPNWMLDEWQDECLVGCYQLVEQLVRFTIDDQVVPNRESCVAKYGKCAFFDVCNAHPRMKDGLLFNAEMFKVSDFDPLA